MPMQNSRQLKASMFSKMTFSCSTSAEARGMDAE